LAGTTDQASNCRVCRFVGDKIVKVRAYFDSAIESRLFEENPI